MAKKKDKKKAAKKVIHKKLQKKKKIIKSIPQGKAYIKASYNNTIVSLTDPQGNVLGWSSAGSVGFKGPKKATPFAASKTVESLVRKLAKTGLRELMVFVKGVGSGRESAIRSLANQGLDIISIKDTTPIPHNGCRPRRPRRV